MTNEKQQMTRREALRLSMGISTTLIVGGALSGCGGANEEAIACAKPDDWSAGDKSLRNMNDYVPVSAEAGKSCATCSFFTPRETGICGHCTIFDGAVASTALCSSWSEVAVS